MQSEVVDCASAPWLRSEHAGANHLQMATLVLVWALFVGAGLVELNRYAATPGRDEAPPAQWPADSAIVRDDRPTLVVLIHPMCPCSRASLSELNRLLLRVNSGGVLRVNAHVLFIAPEGTVESWQNSELCAKARSIAGVTVDVDADRREARLFGASTSGSCLLYGSDGVLLFHGGVTGARGHEGENEGRRLLQAHLLEQDSRPSACRVYGCPLFEEER
ncbi:MAG TPA: hypothetical protein VGX76_02540 [Pirellulales bacterium]|jgi:hypothetical protein|nr:hypothetical protein [Pirellulales bacterium]